MQNYHRGLYLSFFKSFISFSSQCITVKKFSVEQLWFSLPNKLHLWSLSVACYMKLVVPCSWFSKLWQVKHPIFIHGMGCWVASQPWSFIISIHTKTIKQWPKKDMYNTHLLSKETLQQGLNIVAFIVMVIRPPPIHVQLPIFSKIANS